MQNVFDVESSGTPAANKKIGIYHTKNRKYIQSNQKYEYELKCSGNKFLSEINSLSLYNFKIKQCRQNLSVNILFSEKVLMKEPTVIYLSYINDNVYFTSIAHSSLAIKCFPGLKNCEVQQSRGNPLLFRQTVWDLLHAWGQDPVHGTSVFKVFFFYYWMSTTLSS